MELKFQSKYAAQEVEQLLDTVLNNTNNQANILKVDSINAPELNGAVPGSICCVVTYEDQAEISHTYYRYEGAEKGWMTFDYIMRSIAQEVVS